MEDFPTPLSPSKITFAVIISFVLYFSEPKLLAFVTLKNVFLSYYGLPDEQQDPLLLFPAICEVFF